MIPNGRSQEGNPDPEACAEARSSPGDPHRLLLTPDGPGGPMLARRAPVRSRIHVNWTYYTFLVPGVMIRICWDGSQVRPSWLGFPTSGTSMTTEHP